MTKFVTVQRSEVNQGVIPAPVFTGVNSSGNSGGDDRMDARFHGHDKNKRRELPEAELLPKFKAQNKSKIQMSNIKTNVLLFGICVLCLFWILCFGLWPLKLSCHYSYAQEASKEEEVFFVAKKAFSDGFYDVSLELLKRFLKNYPDSSYAQEAELFIGECYFYQNRFLDALNKFEELLKGPKAKGIRDSLLYWIAELHFKGNNFKLAQEKYKMLIDEFPSSSYAPFAYYSLGWCLFQEQDFRGALSYFKIVQEKYSKLPQLEDARLKIVECLYNLKDYAALKEKAVSGLKAYFKDPAVTALLYFYIAEADYWLNNFNASLDGYSKVSSIGGDERVQILSCIGRGWSELKLKKYEEAQNTFSRIKKDGLEEKAVAGLLLGEAMLKLETNRINEAVAFYDELFKINTEPCVLIQAYLGKADALYNLADYSQAISVYKEGLEKGIEQGVSKELIDKLYYGLSWSYLKQGDFRGAIGGFQRIVKTSDDKVVKVSALCQIGDAYLDSGDYDKAKDIYDTILKEYADSLYSDYVQYRLGVILLKQMNLDGAILSFLTFKRNYPDSKLLDEVTYCLGTAYFQKQDYNLSKEAFGKFQDEFKDSSLRPQALYLLGSSFFNLGLFNEAIAAFKNIIRLFTSDIELIQKAEYEIADCFYQMGNEKEAVLRFKSLRSKYPGSLLTPEVLWWLGEYYWRHNDLIMSNRHFSSLIKDFPKSSLVPDAYYAIGLIDREESRYEDAIKNFKRVMELDKADLAGQAAIAVADIYLELNNSKLALTAYESIIKKYSHLASLVYPKMADFFFAAGRHDEALNIYRNALELVPIKEMPNIQFKIAECLQVKGARDEAIEEYLKVTYLYSESNDLALKALLRVAKIYEDEESFKKAGSIYKRIISMGNEEAKYARERLEWIEAHVGK
ncbi:MAG: tetratricopeptide repeat protein [Candidatus Omnitrophota bacterium]|nr:tetratricopeptide repeat protein [Candidatus Omnitrophota bacterium]